MSPRAGVLAALVIGSGLCFAEIVTRPAVDSTRPAVAGGIATRPAGPSGAPTGSSTLLSGLVSAWPLSADGQDDAGANDLTNNNGVTFVAKGGGAPANMPATVASFVAASAQTFSVADNASLDFFDGDWTAAVWARTDTAASRGILSKDDVGANRELYSAVIAAGASFTTNVGGGVDLANTNGGGGIPDATWHLFIFWYDTSDGTLHSSINDANEASGVRAAAINSSAPLIVGDLGAGFHLYMQGQISSPLLWQRTLTATERTCLWNSAAGGFYPFVGLCL